MKRTYLEKIYQLGCFFQIWRNVDGNVKQGAQISYTKKKGFLLLTCFVMLFRNFGHKKRALFQNDLDAVGNMKNWWGFANCLNVNAIAILCVCWLTMKP